MAQIWRIDDVLAYLEEKISDDLASSVETRFYENYKWNNKIDIYNHTYQQLIKQMKDEYSREGD